MRLSTLGLLIAGCLATGTALAQTASTALDNAWVTACAGATQGTTFFDRCQEILNAGPGSGNRRSAAATGNNLEIFSTQARLMMRMSKARARAAANGAQGQSNAGFLGLMATDDAAAVLAEGGRWSLFGSAGRASSGREDGSFERGFDDDSEYLLFGADFRVNPEWSVYAALQRNERDVAFLNNTGRMDASTDSLNLGAAYASDSGFAAGLNVGGGRTDSDLTREIRYRLVLDAGLPTERTLDFSAAANSEGGGSSRNADAYLSWDRALGSWSLRYGLDASWQRNTIDRIAEDNARGLDFLIARQTAYSLQAGGTVQVAKAISKASGVWQPYARLRWMHESRDDVRRVNAAFRGGDNVFRVSFLTAEPDRSFGDVNLGIVGIFPNGWQVYGSYQRLLGHAFLSENRVDIGWRREF